jgi:ferredoxin
MRLSVLMGKANASSTQAGGRKGTSASPPVPHPVIGEAELAHQPKLPYGVRPGFSSSGSTCMHCIPVVCRLALCAKACPIDAVIRRDREGVLAEAHERIRAQPSKCTRVKKRHVVPLWMALPLGSVDRFRRPLWSGPRREVHRAGIDGIPLQLGCVST